VTRQKEKKNLFVFKRKFEGEKVLPDVDPNTLPIQSSIRPYISPKFKALLDINQIQSSVGYPFRLDV
jgi:hypothetical protein